MCVVRCITDNVYRAPVNCVHRTEASDIAMGLTVPERLLKANDKASY